jgi:hypothetical protein
LRKALNIVNFLQLSLILARPRSLGGVIGSLQQ